MSTELSIPVAGVPGVSDVAHKLNRLRAGVLGANDGIVSTAAVMVGVAGATTQSGPLVLAGAAAVAGGAISMALGEYVSVSSSSDAQRAIIAQERAELREDPATKVLELAAVYRHKGLSPETALTVARELTENDALDAHLDAEHHLGLDEVVDPWHAAFASFVAFLLGALLPFLVAVLVPHPAKVPVTFVAVLLALATTGFVGARLGDASPVRAMVRVVVGGALALTATYVIGSLLGSSGVG
jgi:vacuolar iron transporter family protein